MKIRAKIVLPSWWSACDVIALSLYLGVAIFLVVGLLERDREMGILPLNGTIYHSTVIQSITFATIIFLPIIFIALAIVYYKVCTEKWFIRDVCIGIVTILTILLISYLPISYLYESTLAPRKPFHSQLQLFPPLLQKNSGDDSITIAFLGGSTTAWGGWTERVQLELAERFPGKTIRVLNQGVPWYTTLHSLINYETNVRHANPDIVVVMHAINDLVTNADHSYLSSGPFREDYGHFYASLSRIARTKPLVHAFADIITHMFYWEPRKVIDTKEFPGLHTFINYYRRLAQLSNLDKSKLVIMTQPYLYKTELSEAEASTIYIDKMDAIGPEKRWSIATARSGMEQFVEAVRELAVAEGIPLIDLEAVVPKTLVYLKDDVHFTTLGAEIVAKHVSDSLARDQ